MAPSARKTKDFQIITGTLDARSAPLYLIWIFYIIGVGAGGQGCPPLQSDG